jgi:DNA-binding transcriptional ArsR family regulator
MSAGDIAKRFAHAWPTTTRHLRVLEDAKLVTHEQQGTARIYRISARDLAVIEEWLDWFDEERGVRDVLIQRSVNSALRRSCGLEMVLKPLPVLHMMMTVLGLAMKVMGMKIRAGHGIAPSVPHYLARA